MSELRLTPKSKWPVRYFRNGDRVEEMLQFTGENFREVEEFTGDSDCCYYAYSEGYGFAEDAIIAPPGDTDNPRAVLHHSLAGVTVAKPGRWIYKYPKGSPQGEGFMSMGPDAPEHFGWTEVSKEAISVVYRATEVSH